MWTRMWTRKDTWLQQTVTCVTWLVWHGGGNVVEFLELSKHGDKNLLQISTTGTFESRSFIPWLFILDTSDVFRFERGKEEKRAAADSLEPTPRRVRLVALFDCYKKSQTLNICNWLSMLFNWAWWAAEVSLTKVFEFSNVEIILYKV